MPRGSGKWTPEAEAAILKALEEHGRFVAGAVAGGISVDTLSRWQAEDAEFAEACARAMEAWTQSRLEKWRGCEDFGAADYRWELERLRPKEFGKRDAVEVTVPGGVDIRGSAVLMEAMAKDQRLAEALRLIAERLSDGQPDPG